MPSINERTVARLKLEEDGSLSNKRVEVYALMRAEEVASVTHIWTIVMASEKGNLPSGGYQKNVHQSPAFKARLEALMQEKAELGETVWGRLEWQARQNYRLAAARNDPKTMYLATEQLMKIALKNEKPLPKEAADKPEGVPRGRGAPTAEESLLPEDDGDDAFSAKLLNMQ